MTSAWVDSSEKNGLIFYFFVALGASLALFTELGHVRKETEPCRKNQGKRYQKDLEGRIYVRSTRDMQDTSVTDKREVCAYNASNGCRCVSLCHCVAMSHKVQRTPVPQGNLQFFIWASFILSTAV